MSEKKKILDLKGMNLTDQKKVMESSAIAKDWQITFKQADGKVRFALTSEPETAEAYLKQTGAKILKVERT